jgi:AraC-like DNA-binding protein
MSRAAKSTATTSIRLVWPFLALVKKHGYDISATVSRLGLTPAQLENPDTRVSQQLVAELLSEAIAFSGERDIGLIAARSVDSAHLGVSEYIARTRPTLGAAIEITNRYLPLLCDGAGHSLERQGSVVIGRLWFDPELVIHEAAYEFAIASGVLWARRITGVADRAPLSVHFMHARPASTARHDKLFRCPVHFGAESTQVVMSADALELRMPGAEPALGELLERQAAAMLERLPRSDDVASRVRALLGSDLDLRGANAPRIARRLGMSVRSLSRRLDEQATSLRDVLDQVRKHAALRELTHDARPIAEIADRLGFASTQSFHRAFKRWTGNTADAVRRQARELPIPRSAQLK